MKSRLFTYTGLLIVLLSALVLQMCGSNPSEPEDRQQPLDLNGSWELTTTITSNTCGLPNGTAETETVVLAQSGNALSITTFSGLWGTAQVDGQNVHLTGSETSNEFGHTAMLHTEGTGSASATEITGTLTTTVDFKPGGGDHTDCEIATSFVMTKLEESPCLDRASFGDPEASDYVLPYPVGASYSVYQSYCNPTGGHRNQLAYDFSIPIGDTVVAARRGIVREIREDSPDDGQGYGEHNYVFIEHEDGTLAFYAHLMQNSVAVAPSATVEVGQYIALSGNSGQSGEPHLHFGVYEDYPSVEGLDIPVNFRNAQGPLDSRGGLIRWEYYRASPY